jgi:hypothetical membrane protein
VISLRRWFRYICITGPLAVATGLITLAISALINPWFDLYRNAFSDLGRIGLQNSWVFNLGLLIASLLGIAYTFCLITSLKHPISHTAAGVYLIGVIHLMLIALFPEGTKPHWTVSFEFFTIMLFTYLAYSPALWLEGFKIPSMISLTLFIVGLSGSALIHWPSTAMLELFNIILMTCWYAIIFPITYQSNRMFSEKVES